MQVVAPVADVRTAPEVPRSTSEGVGSATGDEADVRARVRAFLEEQRAARAFVPSCDTWLGAWSPEFSRALARAGLLGLAIPAEYGGHGRSAVARYVAIEELLAAGAPVAAHWIADRQFAPSVLAAGTEEQKQRYLPRVAAGDLYVAIGFSEADAGSDLAAVRTRAERADGGWTLTGTKLWSSGAHLAHLVVVLARTTPPTEDSRHRGLSQFIVELPAAGVQVNPIRELSGEQHFNELVFDEAFVPDRQVLGSVGGGWGQVTAELAYERSGPERYLSIMPLLESAAERLGSSGDPFLRRDLGRLAARASTLRQLSLGVARSLAEGRAPEIDAALVKDLGTTFEQEATDLLLASSGVAAIPGAADDEARMLARAVQRSPGFTIRGGTNEILRGIVARSLGLR